VGQVRTGRVTRLADFGAFVELEPGVEGLAHVSTFAPTGQSDQWSRSVPVNTTGAFEILSIDPGKRRIGVALVPEGSARAEEAARSPFEDAAAPPSEEATSSPSGNAAPAEGFGSLADKLRSALEP
jgi:small subunit ribosomal protein S1